MSHDAEHALGPVQSIARAAGVLSVFTPGEPEQTLGVISRRINLPRSTTHRLLASLIQAGLIERGPTAGTYRLGREAIRIGQVAQIQIRPGDRVYRLLRGLSLALDETVGLLALVDNEVLVVERVESVLPFRMAYGVGTRLPAYCTASGRVLLSRWSDQELDAYLEQVRTSRGAPLSRKAQAAVREAVCATRASGYAVDHEEYAAGLTCLAVPISTPTLGCVAALAISGPTGRMKARLTRPTLTAMQEAARAIGQSPELLRALRHVGADLLGA